MEFPAGHEDIFECCLNNSSEILQVLFSEQANCDVNIPTTDSSKTCLIHLAASLGHVDILQVLLQHPNISLDKRTARGATALFLACQEGHLPAVKLLSSDPRVHVNRPRADGVCPLSIACQMGHADIVAYMLEDQRVDVNMKSANGTTPLYYACQLGLTEVVALLLRDPRTNVSLLRSDGTSAMAAASVMGHLDVVKALLASPKFLQQTSSSSSSSSSAAAAAAKQQRPAPSELALWSATQGTLDIPGDDPKRRQEFCPIIAKLLAAYKDNPEELARQLRLESASEEATSGRKRREEDPAGDPEPNAMGKGVTSPTPAAHAREVNRILELEPPTDSSQQRGGGGLQSTVGLEEGSAWTATPSEALGTKDQELSQQSAPKTGDPGDTAKDLHSAEKEKAIQEVSSRSKLLWQVAEVGDLDVVIEIMSETEVEVNIYDNENHHTPFFRACYNNHEEIVYFLLQDPRVDTNFPSKKGLTPIMTACLAGRSNLVSILLSDSRVDPNLALSNGKTPLSIAAQYGHAEVVRVLLSSRANINTRARDSQNHTASDMASLGASQSSSRLGGGGGGDTPQRRKQNFLAIIGMIAKYEAERRRAVDSDDEFSGDERGGDDDPEATVSPLSDSPPPVTEKHPLARVIVTHQARSSTELSCKAGTIVTVYRTLAGGWAEIGFDGRQGYVPTAILGEFPPKAKAPVPTQTQGQTQTQTQAQTQGQGQTQGQTQSQSQSQSQSQTHRQAPLADSREATDEARVAQGGVVASEDGRIKALEQALKEQEEKLGATSEYIKRLEATIEALQSRNKEKDGELEGLYRKVKLLTQSLEEKSESLKRATDHIGELQTQNSAGKS